MKHSEGDFAVTDQYREVKALWEKLKEELNIGPGRQRTNVIYRHSFSCACYDVTSLPVVQIATILGKDHATVLHAKKSHPMNMRFDKRYETAYLMMYDHVSTVLKDQLEKTAKIAYRRVKDSNPDIDVDALIKGLEQTWEIKYRIAKSELEKAEKKISVLEKEYSRSRTRNKVLESELKRIKNLI